MAVPDPPYATGEWSISHRWFGWYPRPDSNRCYRLERGIQGPTDRLRMSGRRVDTSTTVRPWLRTRLRTRPLPELLLAKRSGPAWSTES